MRKILPVMLVAAIGAGAAFYYHTAGNPVEKRQKTAAVKRGEIVVTVSASGSVEPDFQVEVKSKASGEILNFPFEPGDSVKAGQTLLKLDPRTENRNLALKKADLARSAAVKQSAMADLLDRQMKLSRARALHSNKLSAKQELDSAIAREAVAKAKVSEAKAAYLKASLVVEEARERVEDTVITSPINGMIIEKSVERGQIISSGISSVTGGTKLCVVADMSRIFVMALVDETDIGSVSVGQETIVSVDAYPDKIFHGSVIRVYPLGQMRDNITVFKVKIEALGEDRYLLKPKMTANVDMILKREKNVLMIPEQAVRTDDNGGEFVMTENAGKRKIKTGVSNGMDIQIVSGLDDGEKVVISAPGEKK